VSVATSGKYSTFEEFISIIILDKKENYLMVELKNSISDFIAKYEKVSKLESKLFGEVFTPRQIIDEMLDTLPKSTWSNPDIKWLDPAAGIGNFSAAILDRLMIGLSDIIIDNDDRKKHILEEMLFMCDISTKNLFLLYMLFDKNNEYKLNVYRGSFLDEKFDKQMSDVWNLKGFDIVLGNPPYNENGVGKGGGVLWKKFVFKSFNILNDNGYLNIIHPTGWRKPKGERPSAGDVWDLFRKNNLIFVKINDIKIKNFPLVDFYTVQKKSYDKKTIISNSFKGVESIESLDLSNMSFIPHLMNSKTMSILEKLFKNKEDLFTIKYDQSFKPNKLDTLNSGLPHTYLFNGEEYIFAYKSYKVTPDYINSKKIIMTYSNGKKKANLYPKYFETPIGNTRNTMFQIVKEEDNYENLVFFLNSNIIKFLLLITQYSDSPNHKNEFKILNLISKPKCQFNNQDDIYKYYNLTKEEISIIEKIVKE
jgi:site-specific DNA-methyltransferase (adenine-specific)